MRSSTARVLPPPPTALAASSQEQEARQRWFSTGDRTRCNHLVGRLYATDRGAVQARLHRLGVPRGDVEDVCNEVFVVALRRLPSYQGTASISCWLLGIARKLAADHRRTARARTEVLVAAIPQRIDGDEGPLRELERRRERQAVRRAVAALKPAPRRVVGQYVLDEVPMEQVARQERVPLQTAYARLYSGQRALRLALKAPSLVFKRALV